MANKHIHHHDAKKYPPCFLTNIKFFDALTKEAKKDHIKMAAQTIKLLEGRLLTVGMLDGKKEISLEYKIDGEKVEKLEDLLVQGNGAVKSISTDASFSLDLAGGISKMYDGIDLADLAKKLAIAGPVVGAGVILFCLLAAGFAPDDQWLHGFTAKDMLRTAGGLTALIEAGALGHGIAAHFTAKKNAKSK